MSVPTPCEMTTRNSSPSFSVTRGLADHPTPAGVLLDQPSAGQTRPPRVHPPRDDYRARREGRSLRHEGDDLRDGEDEVTEVSFSNAKHAVLHSRDVAPLHDLAIQLALHLDLGQIGDRARGDKHRSKGVGLVEPLREAPLRLGKL